MPEPKKETILDPWIIEEIKRREQKRRQEKDQLEIKIDHRDQPEVGNDHVRIEINPRRDDKTPDRGVIIIETKKDQE